MKYTHYLVDAIAVAIRAGKAILEVYETDFEVENKADNSPLTVADMRSHEIIKAHLKHHGIPSISEEGKSIPFETRRDWPLMWIVDPLDGTKEFVKRNGEFTVNIALVENSYPVAGVVYAPFKDWLYFASVEIGAYKLSDTRKIGADPIANLDLLIQSSQKLPVIQPRERPFTIVGSRSHGSAELEAFVEEKRKQKGSIDFIQAGSSLKICLVAEGAADIYPRLGPTMEWDTAAGQAVVECAGATMTAHQSEERLQYNKSDLLNPWFVVQDVNSRATDS